MSARGVVGIKLGCALCEEVGAFLGDPFIATRLLGDDLDHRGVETDKLMFEYQGFAGVLAFLACGWYAPGLVVEAFGAVVVSGV